MEKLSHLIEEEVINKTWKSIMLGQQGVTISDLMFADDLLIFGETNEMQIRCVMQTHEEFCNMSGQEVSHDKTSILFPRMSIEELKCSCSRCLNTNELNSLVDILGFLCMERS